MYNIPYFKEKDRETILNFMEEHPFAFLTGSFLSGKQSVAQIPMLVEEKNGALYLLGHIMRNTDHHKVFMENDQVMVVFSGPNTYVSATWYTNPHGGSTWNYMSVYATGTITFLQEEELIGLMQQFTLKFEKGNTTSPTVYNNLADVYVKQMLPAIVGVRVKVENLQNVFKLSQNRDEESYRNIISKLEEEGGNSAQVALEMKKRITELFPPKTP